MGTNGTGPVNNCPKTSVVFPFQCHRPDDLLIFFLTCCPNLDDLLVEDGALLFLVDVIGDTPLDVVINDAKYGGSDAQLLVLKSKHTTQDALPMAPSLTTLDVRKKPGEVVFFFQQRKKIVAYNSLCPKTPFP